MRRVRVRGGETDFLGVPDGAGGFAMAVSFAEAGFRALALDGRHRDLLRAYLAGELPRVQLADGAHHRHRQQVWRVAWEGRDYAVKHAWIERHGLERALIAWWRGSDDRRLVTAGERARRERPDAPLFMAQAVLAAERPLGGWKRETILVTEFLAGPPLGGRDPLPTDWREQVRALLRAAHGAGLTSGDPHGQNFIWTDAGLRMIDLSGKPARWLHRAKDQAFFENVYGLPFPPHGIGYWLGRTILGLRRWRSRIRRKGREK